jgi:ABC-2 type transport system permease protein
MTRGLGPLSKALLLGFLRDPTVVCFTVIFPLMFLLLFGILFKDAGAPRADAIQIGAVQMLDSLSADARTELSKVLKVDRKDDPAQAMEAVRRGEAAAAIEQHGDQIVVRYSAADQVQAATVRNVMESLMQTANLTLAGVPPQLSLQAEQVEDKSLQTIQFITPGLLGWAIAAGASFGAALTLVGWRQKKLLHRLRLAPVRTPAIVAARVGISLLIAIGQMAIFIAVALLPFFGLKLSAYWWMVFPLISVGTLAFLSIGLLAGAFAKTPDAVSALVNLVVLPMAVLSGSFFSLNNAPVWLRAVSDVLPLKHLNNGMLDVMVRGRDPLSVLPDIGLLLGFAVVVAAIATRLIRWDDE